MKSNFVNEIRVQNQNLKSNRIYLQYYHKLNPKNSKKGSININQTPLFSNQKEMPEKESNEKKANSKIRNNHFNKDDTIENYIKYVEETKNLNWGNSIKNYNQKDKIMNENEQIVKTKYSQNPSYIFNIHCFDRMNLAFLNSQIHNTKLPNKNSLRNILLPTNKISPKQNNKLDNQIYQKLKSVNVSSSREKNLLNSSGMKNKKSSHLNGFISPLPFPSSRRKNCNSALRSKHQKEGNFSPFLINTFDLISVNESKKGIFFEKNDLPICSNFQVKEPSLINIFPKEIPHDSSIFEINPNNMNKNNSNLISSIVLSSSFNNKFIKNSFNSGEKCKDNEEIMMLESEPYEPVISFKSLIKPIINKAQSLNMSKKNYDTFFVKIQRLQGDSEREIDFN